MTVSTVTPVSIDSSTLLGWYSSFFGGSGTNPTGLASLLSASSSSTTSTNTTSTPAVLYAPTAPWNESGQPSQTQLVKSALGGTTFFNPGAAKLDLPGASADYKNLFTLYSGLNSLYALATAASKSGVSSLQQSQYASAFANGMAQLQTYLNQTSFSKLQLATGSVRQSQTTTVSTPAQASSYTTAPLNTSGDSGAVAPALEGDVAFTLTAQVGNQPPTQVQINLDDMGSTPRTLGNVISYMNGQLQAAGVFASFSSDPIPAAPDTINVGGKSVTVSSGLENWGLTLNTNPAETVTLSAATAGPAVYVGQIVGNQSSTIQNGQTVAADAQSQLLKFNASGDGVKSPDPPPLAAPDQLTTTALGPPVTSVRSTAIAPDGSVYVLANVSTEQGGAAAPGGQDVALQKYDSAGHLLFTTDLGSATSATGLSLAVSADGTQVAVAGETIGSMTAGQTVNDPTGANSFVAVYDSEGDQVWSQQDEGLQPNQANAVAFDASGNVYITGQSQTTTGVQPAGSPSNSFLQVFSPVGKQIANTPIASGGSNTSSGVAVDGNNVYVAGVQNGDAVVTEYDVTNPGSPTLVASRDLGALNGGNIVGVGVQDGTVYVAGTASGGGLSNAGTVTSAASGTGLNAFAATLSTGLAPSSSDAVAYYGGSGSTVASAMTVEGGQVWLTGSVTGSLPGEAAIGAHDGFVAALDVGTGAVGYAQRFTGQDGQASPTSIAVAGNGESVLDQLGLPQGEVDAPVSNLITSTTPVKAGDSFKIAVGAGSPITITVSDTDTMASLAAKINQATGFQAKATAVAGAGGATTLQIAPASLTTKVTLSDGPSGSDALTELGLNAGVVASTAIKNGATVLKASGTPIYGLGLPASLDLNSAADIQTARVQLAGAIGVVENAYQNLKTAATPAAVLALQKAQSSGSAPKYLTNEIANYQSALTRLTAGTSSNSTGFGTLL